MTAENPALPERRSMRPRRLVTKALGAVLVVAELLSLPACSDKGNSDSGTASTTEVVNPSAPVEAPQLDSQSTIPVNEGGPIDASVDCRADSELGPRGVGFLGVPKPGSAIWSALYAGEAQLGPYNDAVRSSDNGWMVQFDHDVAVVTVWQMTGERFDDSGGDTTTFYKAAQIDQFDHSEGTHSYATDSLVMNVQPVENFAKISDSGAGTGGFAEDKPGIFIEVGCNRRAT